MKKTLLVIFVFLSCSVTAQISHIDTLLSLKGRVVYDTTYYLNILGDYIMRVDSTTLSFDSSLVITDVTKINDSTIRVFKGGIAVVPDLEINGNGAGGGGGSGWALTGNAGTDTTVNFIGTTDDNQMRFKINNVPSGRIDSLSTSAGNTSLGFGSLRNVLSNAGSTAFGFKAMHNFTTGSSGTGQNSAFGNQSLLALTTGLRNSAFGYNVLKANVTANDNTAFGYSSLTLSTTGDNTAIGSYALAGQTTGNGNTAVGRGALQTATDGINNTVIGFSSGANIKGFGNVAIGYGSLNGAAVSGARNVAIGYGSTLNLNTSGASNIAIGGDALAANTTASNSVGIGMGSLTSSTGGNNIALGAFSGKYNTSGASQLFISSLDRLSYSADKGSSLIYGVQSSTAFQTLSLNAKTGINIVTPTAYLHLPRGTSVAGTAPVKFDIPIISLTTTNASGTGAVVTLTFATTTEAKFPIGSTVVVAGVTPSGYNGTFVVTSCTSTTITYTSTATGAQTVAGTISQGGLMTTPEPGAMEYNGTRPYFTGTDGVRGYISLTFTGTAAPLTTPSSIGDHFVDTVNKKMYIATGTSSSADWTILN